MRCLRRHETLNENRMKDLDLRIVTPYGEIFNGKVSSVYLPSRDGEMGVLPGHCDLLSLLSSGVVEINLTNGTQDMVAVNWGYVEISSNVVTIIADGAVSVCGTGSTSENLQKAKEFLEAASSDTLLVSGALKKIQSMN